jgi:hypothetical protein
MWGEGARSGIDIDQRFAMLYVIDKHGKVRHAQLLPNVEAALAAATTTDRAGQELSCSDSPMMMPSGPRRKQRR